MNQIPRYPLWLGHAGDCRDPERLSDLDIEAVIQLATEEPPPTLPRDTLFLRIPLHDGSGNHVSRLRLAVEVAAGLLRDRVPTLVCCSAGASRSPAIAACALAVAEEKPASECLRLVQSSHATDLSPGLWHDLLSLLH